LRGHIPELGHPPDATAAGSGDPQRVTIRLLAPAGPVFSGRLAIVSVRLRAPEAGALATWRWDDGGHDQERVDPGSVVRARRTHRYDSPGVYRVRVQVGDEDEAEDRYVTIARTDQVAASGWVRDVERGERIAFGFLITPGSAAAPDAINLRALLGGVELSTNHIAWLMTSQPGSLHFGGLASLGAAAPDHPYRVDVLRVAAARERIAQRMTMSVYALGAVPGHDSPMHRATGIVRPGHIALGPFDAPGPPP
jgi:hypothetical protein